MAAAVFFEHQACVTATIASYQVIVAEDELRHLCSTAGDEVFHNHGLNNLVESICQSNELFCSEC